MAGSCEHSDKHSGSIKCGKYLGNYTFVKKVALRGVGQFVVRQLSVMQEAPQAIQLQAAVLQYGQIQFQLQLCTGLTNTGRQY
jgi:hypothetical protein